MIDLVLARLWEATVITFKLLGLLFKGIRGLIRIVINRKASQAQSSYTSVNEQSKRE